VRPVTHAVRRERRFGRVSRTLDNTIATLDRHRI
jgi:hypothetical protein